MADRPEWIHGATIDPVTRDLRFVSVSGIDSADASDGGCPRKWAYRYIEKIKEPDNDRQKRGIEGHAEIEKYETTGDTRVVGPEVALGLHVVPEPGADLNVEWDVLHWPGIEYPHPLTHAHSRVLLQTAPVKYAGVPLTGFIDCWHRRGTNRGATDIMRTRDPEGTVEVIDWKFVGSMKYAKSETELVHMTQLASYGRWAFTTHQDAPAVRLSLGYFPRKGGRPTKVTKLVYREDVEEQCDHAAGVVRLLQHVAKETSAENVEANTKACDKYGGCYYRNRCTAPMRTTLSMLIGQTAAAEAMARAGMAPAPSCTPPAGNFVPLARVKAPAMASFLKKTAPTTTLAAGKPTEAEIAAEQTRLAEDARRARLQSAIPAGFSDACTRVKKHNMGFPTARGAAARALHALEGVDSDTEIPGTGDISYVPIELPADMAQLADELDQQENVPILPPDAPASDPTKAADMLPEEGEGGEEDIAPAAPVAEVKPVEVKVDIAPVKPVEKAAETVAPAKAKTTRKAAPKGEQMTLGEAVSAGLITPIYILVDAVTTAEMTSLDAWALSIAEAVATANGCKDLRAAPEGSPLAFGKWKGALYAMTLEAPLPPSKNNGYIIHTYGELHEVVAEALLARAMSVGGTYTRGGRS